MQREVIKWLQSVDLSAPVQNPKRDLATGHLAAEIVAHYTGTKYLDVHRLPSGTAAATKRDVWAQVYMALQQLRCTAVTQPLVDAVLRREPNAALTVLECLYEHFTGHALPMRGLDAVGTVGNAYVQPRNATSTARLLAVTTTTAMGGKGGSLRHSTGKSAAAAATATSLFDPLAGPSAATAGSGAAAEAGVASPFPGDEEAFGGDDGDASADGMGLAGGTATGALQQRLALIDNSELAGGANALQAYPRYARPTASTLVHTATGSRKDVVLDRAKYAADEVQQRQHNSHIVQQHAVVQRLQEAAGDAGAGQNASATPEGETRLPAVGPTGSLTALYRGRFYRQVEAVPAGAKAASHAGAPRRSRKSRREDGVASQSGRLLSQDLITIADDTVDRNTLVGPGDPSAPSEHGGTSIGAAAGGGGGGPRVVPKLRVNVHPPALQAALARRSGQAELQERAAALSREHFAKHKYAIRPALSDILADVLAAHKQLQRLFDCCVDDGSGEVLDNVLGHLLSHRDEFPVTCTQACWQALVQHVDGVAAALQRNPDEYGYLMESFSFVFGRDAAQVPLLHVSQAFTVDGEKHEDDLEELRAYSESARWPASEASRRSLAVPARAGSVAGAGHAAASAAAAAGTAASARSPSQFSGTDGSESRSGSPRGRQSVGEALLTATHRAASIAPGLVMSPNGGSLSPTPRQRAIVDTRDGLPLAFAFGFLYRIARKLDVRTAAYVLERYLLRCAKPFLLRRGTVAVREAIARVVSSSFVAPPVVASKTGDDADAAVAAAAAVTHAETALVEFLNGTLARAMLGAPRHVDATAEGAEAGGRAAAVGVSGLALDATARGGSSSGAASPLQLRLLRTYWLMFLHAVADYPATWAEAAGGATSTPGSPQRGGPLAACVLRAARECLASANVDVRTVGVGLTLEYAERWLPRDEDAAAEKLESASSAAAAMELLACVFPALAAASGEGEGNSNIKNKVAPWWASPSPPTWEARLMVLRLCNTLLANPVLETVADGRHAIDAAAAACLRTFAEAVPWQRQLALAVSAKSVDATATPALTEAWRRVLLRIPPAALPVQLMPYDEAPVHLRLMRPLQAAGGAKAGEAARGHSGTSARPQGGDRPAAAPSHAWTLASANDGSASASSPDMPLHLVWGRVLSVYAVAPLNQTWNVRGIVDAVLPASPSTLLSASSSLSHTDTPTAPAALTPKLQLLVMAAALLSPHTASAAPLAVTASLFRLSTVPPTNEEDDGTAAAGVGGGHDEAASTRAFWMAALRRAWPLFQACGVKQLGRPPASASNSTAAAAAPVPAPAAGADLEDIASIVLSLFLRFADDAAVASAVAAAAGNGTELSASAVRWAEATCSGGAVR